MIRTASRVSFALLAFGTVGGCSGEGEGARSPLAEAGLVEVSGAVIAEPLLGERTALYFALTNTGSEPDTLLSVDVGELGSASLHASETVGGVSRMRPREAVELPPSSRVELRPGGLHVMIEGLTRLLAAGDTVVLSVRMARAGSMVVEARVVPYADLLEALDSGR